MQIERVNNAEIAYRRAGKGATVLLLHPIGLDSSPLHGELLGVERLEERGRDPGDDHGVQARIGQKLRQFRRAVVKQPMHKLD